MLSRVNAESAKLIASNDEVTNVISSTKQLIRLI